MLNFCTGGVEVGERKEARASYTRVDVMIPPRLSLRFFIDD